jgi:hypothetical protein
MNQRNASMFGNISRRQFLGMAGAGGISGGWFGRLAAHAADQPQAKSCILLWMSGGPSHLDTFDLKPDAPGNIRGEFRPINTSVPGIQISEHFPKLAQRMEHAAVMRSMSTAESDHQLASYHLHTGYQKRAGDRVFPSLGSIVSRELGKGDSPLPNFVCIGTGPRQFARAGFLGPDHQPLCVTNPDRGIDFVEALNGREAFGRQYDLLRRLETSFQERYAAEASRAHSTAMDRAVRLMTAEQKRAFDLSRESGENRDRYGRGSFGQGCLMARRLIESGVRFVEVLMADGVGWDTHRDNFSRTRRLSTEADIGMAALVDDLKQRGLLDSTLIVWMGEFGRTPQITSGGGRNHWARAWSTVLAGGGIRGGQVIGRTDRHAAEVVERPISVVDFLATVCTVLQIDYKRENFAPGVERPIPIVDTSKPIKVISELL